VASVLRLARASASGRRLIRQGFRYTSADADEGLAADSFENCARDTEPSIRYASRQSFAHWLAREQPDLILHF